ncbi:hypothetical protein CCUS01_16020, partial [Colletotrichum cuscutae]
AAANNSPLTPRRTERLRTLVPRSCRGSFPHLIFALSGDSRSGPDQGPANACISLQWQNARFQQPSRHQSPTLHPTLHRKEDHNRSARRRWLSACLASPSTHHGIRQCRWWVPQARPGCSTVISNYRHHSPSYGAALITESGRRSQKDTLLCVAAAISPSAQGDGLQCRFGSVTAHLSNHLKNWVINDP